MPSSSHAQEIRERGFTVFEGVVPATTVELLRKAVMSRLEELDYSGPLTSEVMVPLTATTGRHYSGVNFWRFLSERPDLADEVLDESVVEVMREVLGGRMRLELVTAAVAGGTRAFLPWHTHIGGFDDSGYPRKDGWPIVPETERITTLLYLDDIETESDGPLLVNPRREDDPTHPPGERDEPWPNQVPVPVGRGSVVALEQRTWHAALPMRRDAHRVAIACLFRNEKTPAPIWSDDSLWALRDRCPLLATLTERPREGAPPAPMPCRTHLAAKERVRAQNEGEPPPGAAAASALLALLEDLASDLPKGWEVDDARFEQETGLVDLRDGMGTTTLEVAISRPDAPAYLRRDGLSYSYRGRLDPERLQTLEAVIDVLHPHLVAWMLDA